MKYIFLINIISILRARKNSWDSGSTEAEESLKRIIEEEPEYCQLVLKFPATFIQTYVEICQKWEEIRKARFMDLQRSLGYRKIM